jgi:hypothetical protein
MQSDVWGTVNDSGISHITGGNFAQVQILSTVGYVISMGTIITSFQSYGSALSAYGLIFF